MSNILKNNNNSPSNIAGVNIPSSEPKATARSLGEVFNLQTVQSMPSTPLLQPNNIQGHSVPVTQSACSGQAVTNAGIEIPTIIPSLQSTHIVPVLNNCGQVGSEPKDEQSAMRNFITSLQASGVNVVENSSDKLCQFHYPITRLKTTCTTLWTAQQSNSIHHRRF